jgi:D-arabinono-1,4-lactone oxidase
MNDLPTNEDEVKAKLFEIAQSVLDSGASATVKKFGREVLHRLLASTSGASGDAADPLDIPTRWSPVSENLRYCESVEEVQDAIREALEKKLTVRAGGSQHSAPQAVFGSNGAEEIRIKLEGRLRDIQLVEQTDDYVIVRAGAGANLGIDPSDPLSNEQNSFTRFADRLGYALPILGGMSHQTIGGYMSTGSAGGSVKYGFADSLLGLELIDGNGNVRKLNAPDDDFYAAAVSMGMYGVITHVTLKLQRRFWVEGSEETVVAGKSILESGDRLKRELQDNTYVHAVWFPQPEIDRVLQYRAEPVPHGKQAIVPYKHALDTTQANYFAALALTAVNKLGKSRSEVDRKLADFIIEMMSPLDEAPGSFRDHWYRALPSDDLALIDRVVRVQFTEIWLDIERTPEVYAALKRLFDEDDEAGGNFGVEVYCAKRSPFWMSPSYGCDVVRVDPYWWEYNPQGDLASFFDKYWKVLLSIPTARLHWGKHLPRVGSTYGKMTIGPDYVAQRFPRFKEWLAKRDELDPHQVFVTDYWRGLFGIYER